MLLSHPQLFLRYTRQVDKLFCDLLLFILGELLWLLLNLSLPNMSQFFPWVIATLLWWGFSLVGHVTSLSRLISMIKCVTSDYISEIQSATDLRPPYQLVLLLFSLAWLAIHLLYYTLHVAFSDLPFLFECASRVISLETINEGLFLVLNRNQ